VWVHRVIHYDLIKVAVIELTKATTTTDINDDESGFEFQLELKINIFDLICQAVDRVRYRDTVLI